jgi:hypothetical protein
MPPIADAAREGLGAPAHEVVLTLQAEKSEYPVGSFAGFMVLARCLSGCSLAGSNIAVLAEEGALLAELPLAANEEGVWSSGPFALRVPSTPGEWRWPIEYRPAPVGLDTSEGSPSDVSPAGTDVSGVPSDVSPAGADVSGAPSDVSPAGVSHHCAPLDFCFTTVAHRTSLAVWGVPPFPISSGEAFTIEVGAQCAEGCCLQGRTINVLNGEEVLASAVLDGGTESLPGMYRASIALAAPDIPGFYDWSCRLHGDPTDAAAVLGASGTQPLAVPGALSDTLSAASPDAAAQHPMESQHDAPEGLGGPGQDGGLAHRAAHARLVFTVGVHPDSEVVVRVMEERSAMPIEGAFITLMAASGFPYRARTDSGGLARLPVPSGSFRLSAAQTDYDKRQMDIVVNQEQAEIEMRLVYNPDLG